MFSEYVKRVTLVFVSLIVAFLIIEGLLRFGGWSFYYLQDKQNKERLLSKSIQPNRGEGTEYVILCIGESTTGLGERNSWPSQLQLILNSIQDQKTFRVINKGAPSRSSDFILSQLPDYLDEYKPDFVLAMVGINDGTTFVGEGVDAREYFLQVESSPEKVKSSQARPTTWLNDLRIYGLINWIAEGTRTRATAKSEDVKTASVVKEDGSEGWETVYGLVNPDVTHLFPRTVSNLNKMVNLTTDRGIKFFFVSYALRKIEILKNAIQRDVFYISNYENFQELLKKYSYEELFTDLFAEDFGHATPFGNRVIADNVARQLLKLFES